MEIHESCICLAGFDDNWKQQELAHVIDATAIINSTALCLSWCSDGYGNATMIKEKRMLVNFQEISFDVLSWRYSGMTSTLSFGRC